MAEWSDWADGNDLAQLSRGTSPLASMGYDADELRADPAKRAEAMDKVASPLDQRTPTRPGVTGRMELAQNTPPPDPRTAVPSDEPPNPTLRARPTPASGAGAAMSQVASAAIPDTLSAPSAKTPASPASPAGPDWQGLAERSAQGALNTADEARHMFESAPNAPDTTSLDTHIEADKIPTNPREKDPVTGKPLYEPTGWQRFGRGVKSAAIGLMTGGLPGLTVGALDPGEIHGGTAYGAPNKDFREDEARRQGTLAVDEQRKSDVVDRFKRLNDQITGRAKDITTTEPGYKDAGTIAIDAQKQQTDAAKEARETKENSPQGKADEKVAVSQGEFDQRNKEADRIFGGPGRGGMQRSLYLANGKLPDPRNATAEEIAKGEAMNVFRRQNGRPPQTMDEINEINAAASGRMHDTGSEDTAVSSIVADSTGKKNEFLGQWQRQQDGSYLRVGARPFSTDKNDKMSANEFNAKVDQFRLDANKELQKHGAQIDATGQVVRRDAAAGHADTSPPPGATHVYKDKQGNIKGWAVNGQYVAAGAR